MRLNLAKSHQRQIEQVLQGELQDVETLHGGCVGEVYACRSRTGARVVAKVDRAQSGALLDEGKMLETLSALQVIPVPRVFQATDSLLLMQHMPGSPSGHQWAQEDAACHLSSLHRVSHGSFGFAYDTRIGGLRQPNVEKSSWLSFFRDHRLLWMAEAAQKEGRLSSGIVRRIEMLAARLSEYMDEPARPALIHGDVWSGNVLVHHRRISAWIDPAIYFADPEMELAFITLFHTFSEPFFAKYVEQGGVISSDFWDTKRHLYNLYPLLVHVRLFGDTYVPQLDATLRLVGA